MERKVLKSAKRIVVKLGTTSITYEKTGNISIKKIENIIRQVADLVNSGIQVILVSSGAQAVGVSTLNLPKKPDNLDEKQAVAAVGQANLMMIYQKLFKEYGINSGQVLITKDVVSKKERKKNTINTFNALLKYGVIPVVNENDTVSTYEIEFGDNDSLSAIVATITDSDLLIILSDIDGLYDDNPANNHNAELIDKVEEIDDRIMNIAGGSDSKFGTGGMYTKILAAKIAVEKGVDMIVANSDKKDVLYKILAGEKVGTHFIARK